MAFRTILIEKALNVRLDLNNIVVNYENEKYWINVDEISILIIDDPRCNVSLNVLSYLCEKGITMLFCDSSHMPVGALETLYTHSRSTKKIMQQINWDKETKEILWTEIVKSKIKNQIYNLEKDNKTLKIEMINSLYNSIDKGDSQNREGTISRIYFKEFFGDSFKRFNEDLVNYSLNYIYQIIRSKIAQEIVAYGYLPSLGVHHKSELNSFNLADDLIEPFRAICDYYVHDILVNSTDNFLTPEIKHKLVDILNIYINYNNFKYKIYVVIQFYVQNLFSFLETGDISKLIFPSL
jgi:CRISPR-associated protein Cas1